MIKGKVCSSAGWGGVGGIFTQQFVSVRVCVRGGDNLSEFTTTRMIYM